jgi:Domain of unknown function (DUF1707)
LRPASFLNLEPGTPVVDRFGRCVGHVHRVLVLETGGFDGIVVKTDAGTRFVDAPEVRRISAGAVTLGITANDVVNPGPHARRRYGMPAARYDRVDVTEADRDEAIECLKRAYCRDELTTDELAERVGIAHVAVTLDELDAAVADVSIS